jgi:hypothetical protein
MTREIRTLIELPDILGVEIECQNEKCRAKVMVPISSSFSRRDGACPQCNAQWFGANFDPSTRQMAAAAIDQINELMDQIRFLSSKERSDIHVPIRLHVTNSLAEGHASDDRG